MHTKFDTAGYCLWESRSDEFVVGIVGSGPGYYSIMEIIHDDNCGEFLPPMRLAALSAPELGGRGKPARLPDADIYPDCATMLKHRPDINLIIELTGSMLLSRSIRKTLPDSISFIDHRMAAFLCGLKDASKAKNHCLRDLDRHQVMLRAVIDEIREDVLLLNRNRTVVDLSRNICERAGKTKEELVGLACWNVQCLGDDPGICPSGPDPECPFETTLRNGVNAEAMITRVDSEDRLKYFRVYSYPIRAADGSLNNVLIMRRDITERTLRERNIQQLDKMAVIGEMATYLAHEIRNPLLAIGGFTKSVRDSPNITDREREKLGIVTEEAKRLEAMLSCILQFAKPGEQSEGETDLVQTVKECVDLMNIGYADKDVRFSVSSTPDVPKINGNPQRIKQCMVNLIKNGLEAMPDGGKIAIRIGLEPLGGFVTVEDSGMGMTDREIEKAFSPFYSTKGDGCGLGLAMIKKIVEELGGTVELHSTKGKGTAVTLHLPPAPSNGIEGPEESTDHP